MAFQLARQKYRIRHVVFHDDIFTLSKSWLERFLARYRQAIGLPFRCNIHTKFFDREIATWLKESNCDWVILGIETINESIRRNVLKRYETNKEIEEALRICDEVELPYHLQHIVGLPFESENDLVDAATFYLRNKKLKRIATFYLSYFPKIKLTQFAEEIGLFANGELLDIEDGKEPIYHHGGSVKTKEILKRCKRFVILFLFIPLLPKVLTKYLIDRKIYKYFHLIPSCFIYAFTLLLYLKNRDVRLISYPKYYFHHLKSILRNRACFSFRER